MATKSDVVSVIAVLIMFDLKILQVPLGILFFNENKTDEMCSVLKDLYKYVPKKNCKVTYHLPDQDFECSEELHHRTLLGGDQLTVAVVGVQNWHVVMRISLKNALMVLYLS